MASGDGEEGGEVQRSASYSVVVVAGVADMHQMGRGEDEGLRCSGGLGVVGAGAPANLWEKQHVNKLCLGLRSDLTKKGGAEVVY